MSAHGGRHCRAAAAQAESASAAAWLASDDEGSCLADLRDGAGGGMEAQDHFLILLLFLLLHAIRWAHAAIDTSSTIYLKVLSMAAEANAVRRGRNIQNENDCHTFKNS
jgi:hypothetical protein